MASVNEKAGATVETTPVDAATKPRLTTSIDTLAATPAGSLVPESARPSNVSTPATAHNDGLNPFDTDLEAMISSRTLAHEGDDHYGMKSTSNSNLKGCGDAGVWPGKDHWKKKAKTQRVNRHSCQMLAKMSQRNRIMIRIGIIALVVAIGVAVGLGVSKATGASIWNPKNHN